MKLTLKASLITLSAFTLFGSANAMGRQSDTSAANQTHTTPTSNPNVETTPGGVTGRTDTHTGIG